MKKILLFLFLTLPLILLAQQESPGRLYGLIVMDDNEFRTLVNSKRSQVKMSENEISEIRKIVNVRKEEFLRLKEEGKKTIPYGPNGLPIGKVDPVIREKVSNIEYEIHNAVYEILGDHRYNLLRRTLIDENERKNSERLQKSTNKRDK